MTDTKDKTADSTHQSQQQINIEDIGFEYIAENLFDSIYLVDTNRIIRYWNKAAELLTGFEASEVIGMSCSDGLLCHVNENGSNLCKIACPLAATLNDDRMHHANVFLHHKKGHRIEVLVRTIPIKNSAGETIGATECFVDNNSQSANQQRIKELERLALLDTLTQLPNRNYLERELTSIIDEHLRNKVPFGLFFIDIDHFKQVNDTFGHIIGDEVLRFVSKTLAHNSRQFDIYGRWGGEEFIGIIRNVELNMLLKLGERMRMLIDSCYIKTAVEPIHVTVTIGVTMLQEGDTITTLIDRADTLMYKGKSNGRNRVECEE